MIYWVRLDKNHYCSVLISRDEGACMNNDELRNKLETDYGIQVYPVDLSEEEITSHGYRKVTGEEASHFDAIFQFAPHVVKDAYYASAFQDSFNAAVQGSYKVKIEKGLHLGKSHTTPGAFKGNAYDKNNNLKTQADWIVNGAELDVSMVPQIASSVFSAVAFVTGQYFMTEIDRSLSEIKTDTKDIRQFLENEKYGKIEAAIDSLTEIIRHLKFIKNDPERRNRTLLELSGIQSVAKTYIDISQREITQEQAKVRDDDTSDIFKKHVKIVTDSLKQYQVQVELYCQSKLLKMYLDNIWSIEELSLYQDELNAIVDDYFAIYDSLPFWINRCLNQNYSLNIPGKEQSVVAVGVSSVPRILFGLFGSELGSSIHKSVNEAQSTARESKKDRQKKDAEWLIYSVSRYHYALKKPIISLNKYIETAENGIEIIKIGDSVYTNLPEEVL